MRRAIDVDADADASLRACCWALPLTTTTTITITITTPTPHELLINLFFFSIGISGRHAHSAAFDGVLVLLLLFFLGPSDRGIFSSYLSHSISGFFNRAVLGA
jgi:hypothetical protein